MERRQFLQATVPGAAATLIGVAPSLAATDQPQSSKEDLMTSQTRPYEPLTSENGALVLERFIDAAFRDAERIRQPAERRGMETEFTEDYDRLVQYVV